MRTRILGKMLNSEVEEYLKHNDIIIVPVGTTEMHGGFPLDVETVISEAIGLKMAEACDGIVLTGLPYFYSGATASGRGTTQVSVRQGIDYLSAIAHSLLRQGFKRQIYVSLHGPAHMTCSPMVRDFFDETGVPILYMDMTMQLFNNARDLFVTDNMQTNPLAFMETLDSMFVAGYDIMGRLEDVPLTTEHFHTDGQTCSAFDDISKLAYQSGAYGYCFADPKDHASTTPIPTAEKRQEMAEKGKVIIDKLVERINLPHVVEQLRNIEAYTNKVEQERPWMPSAYNKNK